MPQPGEQRALAGFHRGRVGGALVVVALQVQHAVDHQMGAVRGAASCPVRRFAADHGHAQHDVADARLPLIVHEGQHVGRVVLAAVFGVERAALDRVDEAHGHHGVAVQRGAHPAPDLAAGRQAARCWRTAPTARGPIRARAQRGASVAGRQPGGLALVGVDDLLHQRVADDVGAGEAREADPAHAVEDALRLDQAALLAAREVDLRDVAGDHRLGAEADARQEHLHLLGRRVLRLVEDDEAVVQRAAAHVRERRDLDGLALEQLRRLVEAHQVVQRVVERTQVGVDLLREVAGQEAQPLAGLHRRAHQHQALDRVALQCVDGAGDGEVGLAGARRADAERDVVLRDVLQVRDLVGRAAVQVGAARPQFRAVVAADGAGVAPARDLDQSQLDVVDRKRRRRPARRSARARSRQCRRRRVAADGELTAAMA